MVADIIECCNAILLPEIIAGGSHFLVSWMSHDWSVFFPLGRTMRAEAR